MRPRSFVVAFATALLLASASSAAELEAQLGRQRLAMGETVELLLRLRGGQEAPNISALGADFEVVDVRQSVRTQIVNGRRDASIDWILTLLPRRVGTLEIPALRAGQAESAALSLEVASARDHAALDSQPGSSAVVLLEAEVDDPEPYVQSKVLLTARLTADGVLGGEISDPVVAGAVVERVGKDRHFRSEIGGRSFDVVERQYAVFPQRSGELKIGPLRFEGRVRDEQPRRRGAFGGSPFDAFGFDSLRAGLAGSGGLFESFFAGGGRPVRASSDSLTLAVRARPEAAGGEWWLPARKVELLEQWQRGTPVFRVGEPVNRDLVIRATGLSGAQLPELALAAVDGVKQYREPAVDDTVLADDEVVSVKLQRVALVPTRAGQVTLPAVELAWWDTEADMARTARLPERRIQVEPGNAAPAAPLGEEDLAAASLPGPGASATASAGQNEPAHSAVDAPAWGSAVWVGAGLGALILGAVGVQVLRRHRFSRLTREEGRRGPQPGLRAAEARLRRACRASNPTAAVAALREIAARRWPESPPPCAAAWAERLTRPELAGAVEGLNGAVYARGAGAWQGDELWQAYRGAGRRRRQKSSLEERVLPALYPTR